MQLNNSVLNICCITTYMECTIIQLCTYNHIYQHVDIYTAQTNTFSQVKYYYNFFFSINVSLFHYKISLKCSSTNVLVFVFKFFSYNQTDNPLLSSTVKYITRINIMLQQRPISPFFPHILLPSGVPLPRPHQFLPSMSPSLRLSTHRYTNRQTEECGNAGGGREPPSEITRSSWVEETGREARDRGKENIKQSANA